MHRAVLSCQAGAYGHPSLWASYVFGDLPVGISQEQAPDQAHSKGSRCPAVCDGPHSGYLPLLTGGPGACCPVWATGQPDAPDTASTRPVPLQCCCTVWALPSPTTHIRGPGGPEVGSSAEKPSPLIPFVLQAVILVATDPQKPGAKPLQGGWS